MTPLRATYRLQFTADFRFADGAALAPYLASLGISHVYASPVFAARAGSTHGYDVTDYNRLNPELGTESEFRAMVRALRQQGMGLILDFVPNHMGIGGADNAFWDSVLEWGEASPHAHWFDIDWQAPGMEGKVLFPFLGAPYGTVLAQGGLELRLDPDGRLAVWAHDSHRLPICPRDYALVLEQAGSPLAPRFAAMAGADPEDEGWAVLRRQLAADGVDLGAFRDAERLDALIARQHWRAAKFDLDADAINYRRFFTISDLAGVRVEDPQVFAQTHALILSLLREGAACGIRIDHIDGLRDPRAYCRRLREAVGQPFLLFVEKILGPGEALPQDWEVDGTTGYEFANEVVTLLADPSGSEALDRIYHDSTGLTRTPAQIVHEGKMAVMAGPMRAETLALTDRIAQLAAQVPEWADLGQGTIGDAVAQTVAGLDIYRTYVDDRGIGDTDRARIDAALDRARTAAPHLDPVAFDLIRAVVTLEATALLPDQQEAIAEAAMRFQQLSGPVMAKGLEDRALYRFNRLIALNEVGSHPGQYTRSPDAFHKAQMARLKALPQNMLCTSSHDTKRGEDARMRIVTLSAHTGLWQQKLPEWAAILGDALSGVDPNEAYFFWQLLLGCWPEDAGADASGLVGRVTEAMLKSVREAGVNSRWVFGDDAYEDRIRALVQAALISDAFRASFTDLWRRLRPDARAASLIQTALKLTVPGVPDIYQGAEMDELSLVDPDNRRPVDFARRVALLSQIQPGPILASGLGGAEIKLRLVASLLRLRQEQPDLFAQGSYQPLIAHGPAAAGFLGFARRHGSQALIVAAALHPGACPASAWAETRVTGHGATGRWRNLINDDLADPGDPSDLFRNLPLAILRPD